MMHLMLLALSLAWRHKFITLIAIVLIILAASGNGKGQRKNGVSVYSLSGKVRTSSSFDPFIYGIDEQGCMQIDPKLELEPTPFHTLEPGIKPRKINKTNCFTFIYDYDLIGRQFSELEINESLAAELVKSEGISSATVEFTVIAFDTMLATRGSAQRMEWDETWIRIFSACNLETTDGPYYEKQNNLPDGYLHNDPKQICDFILLHELGHAVDLLKGGQNGGVCRPQDRCETMEQREKDAAALAMKWFDAGARLIKFKN